MLPGVYKETKKDNTPYFRASITHNHKHISLGSYDTEIQASATYSFAEEILKNREHSLYNYSFDHPIKFEKYISLINLRDNNIYFSNPIYLRKRYFSYFLSPFEEFKFDTDDLFYFSQHKIMARGNHYFVSEYGMQTSLRERFGIKSFAVEGRDYRFVNQDSLDYRRENIIIINQYHGVMKEVKKNKVQYKTTIHIRSNYVVGRYSTETEAAIAYNKAADTLTKNGYERNFFQNYIEDISNKEYAEIYSNVKISDRVRNLNSPD